MPALMRGRWPASAPPSALLAWHTRCPRMHCAHHACLLAPHPPRVPSCTAPTMRVFLHRTHHACLLAPHPPRVSSCTTPTTRVFLHHTHHACLLAPTTRVFLHAPCNHAPYTHHACLLARCAKGRCCRARPLLSTSVYDVGCTQHTSALKVDRAVSN